MDDLKDSDIEKWNDEDESLPESPEPAATTETIGEKYAKTLLSHKIVKEFK